MTQRVRVSIDLLKEKGIEVLPRDASGSVFLPVGTRLEAPCSLKWVDVQHNIDLGMYSYQVSGFACAAEIGRYCSIGEDVQIGRQNHPMGWASTSPAFYLQEAMFSVGGNFSGAADYHHHVNPAVRATSLKSTRIGHDVWIGHGAYVAAGVNIGSGAVIAACAVVAKDVPPFAVVAGNPAVIKKWRLPPELISPMLRCQWWEYAPWQLADCNISNAESFVHNVMHLDPAEKLAASAYKVTADGKLREIEQEM